ncbi:MAG: hypothetical protein AB7U72_06755 [Methanosarcina sp.]
MSVAKRTPPSRGGTREGQRTSEAGLGKDSGLPRRDSGRTADFRGGTRVAKLGESLN